MAVLAAASGAGVTPMAWIHDRGADSGVDGVFVLLTTGLIDPRISKVTSGGAVSARQFRSRRRSSRMAGNRMDVIVALCVVSEW